MVLKRIIKKTERIKLKKRIEKGKKITWQNNNTIVIKTFEKVTNMHGAK